jgi:hypothetical protein
MKCLVISQPKAGTYLLANLLINLGLTFSNMHLQKNKCKIWDGNINEARNNQEKFSHKIKLSESIKLIKENNFAVSHIHYDNETSILLNDFKKILITRNIEEIKDSLKRFNNETTRNHKESDILFTAESVLDWKNDDIFEITFEDIINENAVIVDKLQIFLFGNIRVDSLDAIRLAKKQESITKSSLR